MEPMKLESPNWIEDRVYQDDTWSGFTTRILTDNVAPASELAAAKTAKVQFRSLDRRFVYELNTETLSEGGLPKDWPDNTTGVVTINDVDMGTYIPTVELFIAVEGQTLFTLLGGTIYPLNVRAMTVTIDGVETTAFTETSTSSITLDVAVAVDQVVELSTQAVVWEISVNSQPLPMEAGTYLWELEVIDITDVKRSLLKGRIDICQDTTK